jgi:hypothetical protein
MNKTESASLSKTANQLWPSINPTLGALLRDMLTPYDFKRALAVVKTHRMNHEFIDLPQLRLGLEADRESADARKKRRDSERIVDWIRRTLPVTHANQDDGNVIRAHFQGCWGAVESGGAERGAIDEVRGMIRGHARTAFVELGWPAKDADERSDECVGKAVPA